MDKRLREFLFGNSQIGFGNQGLVLQVSYMELGTPYKTWSYLFYQTKIWFWERERERFGKELTYFHIQTYSRNFSKPPRASPLLFALFVCLFFLFFLFLMVMTLSHQFDKGLTSLLLYMSVRLFNIYIYIYIYIYQQLTLLILERAFIFGPINLSKI